MKKVSRRVPTQACSHGGIRKQCFLNFVLPGKFCGAQKNFIWAYIENKSFATLKIDFPPNLKIWLRACFHNWKRWERCYHAFPLRYTQWRSQPKILGRPKCGGKMFDFRWATVFCLVRRFSKHKM